MKLIGFLKIAALGAIMTSLAACSSNTQSTAGNVEKAEEKVVTEAAVEKGTKKLSVGIWDSNQEPGLSEIMTDFTQKTGIETEIQVVTWGDYWTMLAAGAQGGTLPDVFWMHSNESERYMSNDMLLDLTDRIAASEMIDLENYPEDIIDLYKYDGKNFAVPKDVDTIALWYNKTMFDEAGIDYPTADWTWDDLYEASKKLKTDDHHAIAIKATNAQGGYYNMIFDEGGYILSDDKKKSGLDDPNTIKGMQIIERLVNEDLMVGLDVMAETNEEVLFASGKVAMVTQGSWMVSFMKANDYIRENCDVVELPKSATTGRRASIYNGLGWAAAATTSMPDEAWALIEYLGSKEAQLKQAQLGVTMSAYKGTSEEWGKSADFNLSAYINMMDDMIIYPHSKYTVRWEEAMYEQFKRAYSKEITMEEACKEAAMQMNEILAEE